MFKHFHLDYVQPKKGEHSNASNGPHSFEDLTKSEEPPMYTWCLNGTDKHDVWGLGPVYMMLIYKKHLSSN